MTGREFFSSLWPLLLLPALAAAGPVTVPFQQGPVLQGPIGTDIVPGLPYGAFPPGLEPRLPILQPPPTPPIGASSYGASPTQTLQGCAAYAQSYQSLDCEAGFNQARPGPVTAQPITNPPLPNAPSAAAVPPTPPLQAVIPQQLQTRLVPGTIIDSRSGAVIPPGRPLP
jgi:hypothetical protein